MRKYLNLLTHVLVQGKSAKIFIAGIILGLGFSMTVILATLGIMDGYEKTLKEGLRLGQGDLVLTARHGFVKKESVLKAVDKGVGNLTFLLVQEAFALNRGNGQGVQLRAVEPQSFEKVSKLFVPLLPGEILLGAELAKSLGATKGDEIVLAQSQNGGLSEGMPNLLRFKYVGEVRHGPFEADSRFAYVHLGDYQKKLGISPQLINQAFLSIRNIDQRDQSSLRILAEKIELDLYGSMRVKPYYSAFNSLLEAVQIEKVSISLILQIIVVVSIFNLVALVLYLTETRAQEIFLIEALGVSKKILIRLWWYLLVLLWLMSIILSFPMLWGVNLLLGWLSTWALPGQVYSISELRLHLGWSDFLVVYLSALLWMTLVFLFIFWRLKKRSLIEHLRHEFS